MEKIKPYLIFTLSLCIVFVFEVAIIACPSGYVIRIPKVGVRCRELAVTIVKGNFAVNNGICNVYSIIKIKTDTKNICVGFFVLNTCS